MKADSGFGEGATSRGDAAAAGSQDNVARGNESATVDAGGLPIDRELDAGGLPIDGQLQQPEFGLAVRRGSCDVDVDGGVSQGRLTMVPEAISVFRHVSSSCESLRSSVLFQNSGPDNITVMDVMVSSASFEARTLPLPLRLNPEESLELQIGYLGKASETARISIDTDRGCSEYIVRGVSTTDGLFTHSHYAIDFGELIGATRKSKTVLIRYQKDATVVNQSTLAGVTAGPEPVFEISSSPAPIELTADCSTLPIAVTFNAAKEPGLSRGELAWEVITNTNRGRLAGGVYVTLFGRSR